MLFIAGEIIYRFWWIFQQTMGMLENNEECESWKTYMDLLQFEKQLMENWPWIHLNFNGDVHFVERANQWLKGHLILKSTHMMYTGVSSVEFRSMADGDTLLTFWRFSMVFQERSNKFDEVQLSKCLPKNKWWFDHGLWFGFPIGFHHRFHGFSMFFHSLSIVFHGFSRQRFPWIRCVGF